MKDSHGSEMALFYTFLSLEGTGIIEGTCQGGVRASKTTLCIRNNVPHSARYGCCLETYLQLCFCKVGATSVVFFLLELAALFLSERGSWWRGPRNRWKRWPPSLTTNSNHGSSYNKEADERDDYEKTAAKVTTTVLMMMTMIMTSTMMMMLMSLMVKTTLTVM